MFSLPGCLSDPRPSKLKILPTVVSSFTDGDHTGAHTAQSRCVKRGRTEGLGYRKWEEKWDCMNFAVIKKKKRKKKQPTDVRVPKERHLDTLSLSLSFSPSLYLTLTFHQLCKVRK